jgi:type I restriction enzyme, S subunit
MVGEKAIPEGYKQTEVGVVPEEWEIISLNSIADVRDGTHESPKYVSNGVLFITSKNISKAQIDFSSAPFISEKDAIEINKRSKVDLGDILMSMIGTIGNSTLITKEPNFCIKNVALIKPSELIGNRFLAHLIASDLFQRVLIDSMDGGIQKFISLGSLRNLSIPLPPLPEQKAIAEVLSDTDALIESLEALIAKKRAVKQGSMQELLTGRRRLPGFAGSGRYRQTEVGVVPEEWEVVSIANSVNHFIDYRGRTPKKLGMEWGNGDILALSANNVQMGKINLDKEAYFASELLYKKWMQQGDCEKGDILLTMEAPLGSVAQIPNDKKYILSQRVLLLKPTVNFDKNFYAYLLSGSYFQQKLSEDSTGSTAKGIQRKKLEKIPIPLPPLSEQKAIAEVLSDMDTEIEALEQKRDKYKKIKQGMMDQLLTGKVRLLCAGSITG